MQSHNPSFIFNPNFNFATDSLFGSFNTEDATITPPVEVCFIISENNDFLISEDGNNLIMEQCLSGFVLTEPGDYVLTEPGDNVLVE